jgi:hypothetical protein
MTGLQERTDRLVDFRGPGDDIIDEWVWLQLTALSYPTEVIPKVL